jgi:hypothetical protein
LKHHLHFSSSFSFYILVMPNHLLFPENAMLFHAALSLCYFLCFTWPFLSCSFAKLLLPISCTSGQLLAGKIHVLCIVAHPAWWECEYHASVCYMKEGSRWLSRAILHLFKGQCHNNIKKFFCIVVHWLFKEDWNWFLKELLTDGVIVQLWS